VPRGRGSGDVVGHPERTGDVLGGRGHAETDDTGERPVGIEQLAPSGGRFLHEAPPRLAAAGSELTDGPPNIREGGAVDRHRRH
jgi:hypothetical protein